MGPTGPQGLPGDSGQVGLPGPQGKEFVGFSYTLSHYRRIRPAVRRFYSAAEPPHRSLHFIPVVHTTDGVICSYRHLAKCSCPSTTD